MRTLITVSTSIVFLSLYLMWAMSFSQTLKFMTSNAYTKLSFDLVCAPGTTYRPGISQCRPTEDNRPDGDVSPADVLINLLTTGSIMSDATDPNSAHDFAGLLSSIMMNGAPMLGLDDFVHLSDFVNKNLGPHGRGQIMNSTAYRDKFGNFLDVRRRELRIAPYSCWTGQFLSHLNKNSLIAKDLSIIQYPSMSEAMKDCCDNVWAIVEIIGPKEGFDCSLFVDTGGTKYRSSNPLSGNNSSDHGVNIDNNNVSKDDSNISNNGDNYSGSLRRRSRGPRNRSEMEGESWDEETLKIKRERAMKSMADKIENLKADRKREEVRDQMRNELTNEKKNHKRNEEEIAIGGDFMLSPHRTLPNAPGDNDLTPDEKDKQKKKEQKEKEEKEKEEQEENEENEREEDDVLDVVQLRALTGYGPSVTVRMLPSAIPDTRNFE